MAVVLLLQQPAQTQDVAVCSLLLDVQVKILLRVSSPAALAGTTIGSRQCACASGRPLPAGTPDRQVCRRHAEACGSCSLLVCFDVESGTCLPHGFDVELGRCLPHGQAAGSSLLARLVNLLVADALGRAGLADLGASAVLPLATGMALTLTLLALRPLRPAGARCGERGASQAAPGVHQRYVSIA